jgi:hypothetical protein
LARLNPAGGGPADLLYSTYFGGSDNDLAYAVAVDGDGVATVAGSTLGVVTTTPGAFQTTAYAGSIDVFLARFSTRPFALFLHGSGAVANPPVLSLDPTAPTSTAPRYSESTALRFSDGNPWVALGAWSGHPTVTNGILSIDDLTIWLGRKNGNGDEDDVRFDVRAEVLKNGTPVSSGGALCVPGATRDSNRAKSVNIPLAPTLPVVFDGSSDTVSLRLMTRIGTDGAGNSCGGHSTSVGVRVYFDALSTPAHVSITPQ